MIKKPLIVLTVLVLNACNDQKQEVNLQRDLKKDTTAKGSQIMFAEPEIIDSSHIIIYPLVLEKTSYENYESYGSSTSGERSSYWNLIFYNTETAQQHLLTADKKILIYSINLSSSSSSSSSVYDATSNNINIFKSNIIYLVASKDYNLNSQLDQDDPTYLYVSDREGNGFRQISTEDYNIISWEIVKGTSKIIMQGQKDDNGDKKFDDNDKRIPLVVDLLSMKRSVATFNSDYIDTLQQKLETIWKPLKK